MNKVVLMGRLTRDPEVRYTQGEQSMAVARFTLAVDRRFRKGGSDTSGAAGQGNREQNTNQSRTNDSYGQCEMDADGFMTIPDGVEGLPFMD